MADAFASRYRYVKKDKDGNLERVVYSPGDKPVGLPADVVKDLKEKQLIIDERRLTETGVRIPWGLPDRDVK